MALLPLGLLAKHWLALGRFPFACLPGVMEGPQGPEGCPAPSAPGPDLQASAPASRPGRGSASYFIQSGSYPLDAPDHVTHILWLVTLLSSPQGGSPERPVSWTLPPAAQLLPSPGRLLLPYGWGLAEQRAEGLLILVR